MVNKLATAVQTILVAFCLVGAVLGQSSETIHVTDITDIGVGNPVSLDGIVQFVGRKTICSVKAYNNADKAVIALVVEFRIRRPDGLEVGGGKLIRKTTTPKTWIAPNGELPLFDGCATETAILEPGKAKAEAEVLFVRCADGSKWGDEALLDPETLAHRHNHPKKIHPK